MSLSDNQSVVAVEDFKLVSYKRKHKKKHIHTKNINIPLDSTFLFNFDTNSLIRQIENAKSEINSSDLFASFKASLREGFDALNKPKFKKIVCLGLGRFVQSMISRYQLALVLCLRDIYRSHLVFYDPVFTNDEKNLLKILNCEILDENVEGKYKILETTIFYLPHCPKELTNNLLWSNWGLNLHYCVIIANSFMKIVDSCLKKNRNSFEYIHRISPHVLELAVINNFQYYEVFNDTAIHVFPWQKLCLVADDFWHNCCEPTYEKDDYEIVTKDFNRLSINY